jgi:hypothetical protein
MGGTVLLDEFLAQLHCGQSARNRLVLVSRPAEQVCAGDQGGRVVGLMSGMVGEVEVTSNLDGLLDDVEGVSVAGDRVQLSCRVRAGRRRVGLGTLAGSARRACATHPRRPA